MKYRSRTDILANILDIASGYGANKTKIMYGAYLSILIANGLLERLEAENLYRTTEKGRNS